MGVILSGLIGVYFAVVIFSLSGTVHAAEITIEMQERATHPSAVNQPSLASQMLNSLIYYDGKVYSGYGDYNSNTGPIDIHPFNPTTNSFEPSAMTFQSESIGGWRVINDKLYTVTTDPTCGALCSAGYAEYESGGEWQLKTPVNAFHIFDMATLTGDDLWLFGSNGSGDGQSAIWRSLNGEDDWQAVRTGSSGARYYWGASLNNSMYVQQLRLPSIDNVEYFDGDVWDTVSADEPVCDFGTIHGGPHPVTFGSKIVCFKEFSLRTFDGETIQKIQFDESDDPDYNCYGSTLQTDVIATDEYVYVLCRRPSGSGPHITTLLRSRNLEDWDKITGLPENASSVAVNEENDEIYVGTEDSKIFSGSLPVADNISPLITITAPLSNAVFTTEDVINVSADAEDNVGLRDVVFKLDGGIIETKEEAPYTTSLSNHYNTNTKQWRISPGIHTISVTATDTSDNETIQDVTIRVEPLTEDTSYRKNLRAVLPSGKTSNSRIILSVNSEAAITCSGVSTESSKNQTDAAYDFPYGLINFCLAVPHGSTQDVSLLFESKGDSSLATARKYSAVTSQYGSILGAVITEDVIGGIHYLRLAYQITDGGMLDEDGEVNGEIIDPVGLGFDPLTAALLVSQQTATFNIQTSLAQTGANRTTLILLTVSLLVVPISLKIGHFCIGLRK
jgi:hypothetical protein